MIAPAPVIATPECDWQSGVCLTRAALHRAVVETTKLPAGDARNDAFIEANRRYAAHSCTLPDEGWGPERGAMSAAVPGGAEGAPTHSSGSRTIRPPYEHEQPVSEWTTMDEATLDEIDGQVMTVCDLYRRALHATDIQSEYLDARLNLLRMIERYARRSA